jgi:single-stranded DNA-binding protein
MAIQVSVTGFMQEVKEFSWGTVLELAHPNRKKNDAGEWETISTDYIDIIVDSKDKAAYANILSAPKSTRIAVKGNLKWNAYTKRDGEPGAKMKIYPTELELVDAVSTVKQVLKPLDISDAPF